MCQKYIICEGDSAAKFLEAALFLQDDVYKRTCDLQDSNKVFGVDLYYHLVCLPAYVNKCTRTANKDNDKIEVQTTKRDTFNLYYNFSKVHLIQNLLSLLVK